MKGIPRIRKILRHGAVVCGGAAVGIAGPVSAFSLGAVQVQSALTSPLEARLPIALDASDNGLVFYEVRLLPAAQYSQLGLLAPAHDLNDFTVSLQGDAAQGFWVRIRSDRAVREPILSLLLEIRKPGATLVRNIDLLLDPPDASAGVVVLHGGSAPGVSVSPDLAAETAADPIRQVERRPNPVAPREILSGIPVMSYRSGRAPLEAAEAGGAMAPSGISHYYGPVRPGESLSRIAQRARLDRRMPLPALIKGLHAFNPGAFEDGPDSLKVGVMLAVPTAATIEKMGIVIDWYEQPVADEPQFAEQEAERGLDWRIATTLESSVGSLAPEATAGDGGAEKAAGDPQLESGAAVTSAMRVGDEQVTLPWPSLALFRLDTVLDREGVRTAAQVQVEELAAVAVPAVAAPSTVSGVGPTAQEAPEQSAGPDTDAPAVSADSPELNPPVALSAFWSVVSLLLLGLLGWAWRRRARGLSSGVVEDSEATQSPGPILPAPTRDAGLEVAFELSSGELNQIVSAVPDADEGQQYSAEERLQVRQRLSTVLASERDDSVRREARLAMACLDHGDVDLAIEILAKIEAAVRPVDLRDLHGTKVVPLNGRKSS